MKLRNLDWLNSVWRISTVNPFLLNYEVRTGKFKEIHIAPFPADLPFRLITLYSKEGDYVLDPFCGSGSTNIAALSLFRKTIGYDLEEKYINMAKERCGKEAIFYSKSSENMSEIKSNSIHLCITSPPYLHLRQYSDNKKNIGNLDNPYPALTRVFKEVFRVLKPEGYFCLNVADVPDGYTGKLTTFPYDMVYICQETGFRFKNVIIWDKGITLKEWHIKNQQIFQNHEYVWIFQKSKLNEREVKMQKDYKKEIKADTGNFSKIKQEQFNRQPIIESSVAKSEDGKWIIHKTTITDIKPVSYFEKVLEGSGSK